MLSFGPGSPETIVCQETGQSHQVPIADVTLLSSRTAAGDTILHAVISCPDHPDVEQRSRLIDPLDAFRYAGAQCVRREAIVLAACNDEPECIEDRKIVRKLLIVPPSAIPDNEPQIHFPERHLRLIPKRIV